MTKQIPADDILLEMRGPDGERLQLLVASTSGENTARYIRERLPSALRPGWTLGVQVHSPSRFSPEKHPCKHTNCDNYTPRRERRHQTDWPLCVCGAIAQDHD